MRLTFDRLWIWIAIALPAFVALLVPLPAVDLAYQVRAGSEILASGAVPRMDTWTFTVAGTPWLDQQWLAQVVLALGHRVGGWELLAVLLWLVAARLRHPRAYLLAPVVVVLWANVHGSFVLGPALLGYAWVSDVVARRPATTAPVS
jgi:hypothetical protein